MFQLKTAIAYLSYSGNTAETAEIIETKLRSTGAMVDMHRIGIDRPLNPARYDRLFIGTFTWERGSTPDEVKDFVREIGYKPDNIAVFGTGDTQFGGDDLFCLAADKLVTFYASKWEALKIEQSPRGAQENKIDNWLKGVLQHEPIFA